MDKEPFQPLTLEIETLEELTVLVRALGMAMPPELYRKIQENEADPMSFKVTADHLHNLYKQLNTVLRQYHPQRGHK